MRAYSKAVPTTATDLVKLLGVEIPHASWIGLQAPEDNNENIFFGDAKIQPFELRPKANALLPVTNGKAVFVRGTTGDLISVAFF